MQAANSSRAVLAPVMKGLLGALLAGLSTLGSAATAPAAPNMPAHPFMNGFTPQFRHVARVSCPASADLPRSLLDAAACGDAFRVRVRLAEAADPSAKESRPGLEGRTALHHAVQRGDLESVRLLLAAGADANAQDAQGDTPLHLLAWGERMRSELDIARALIEAGADARIRNGRNATPLGALIVSAWYRIDPLRISALPLGMLLDEAEASGPLRVAAAPPTAGVGLAAGGTAEGEMAPEAAVREALVQWASAWAARDVDAYLDHYADDFQPPDGKTREAWQAQRRTRIGGAKEIEVTLSDVAVAIDGDRAVVEFTQDYRSDSYRSTDRKRAVMTRSAGRWRIVEELAAR